MLVRYIFCAVKCWCGIFFVELNVDVVYFEELNVYYLLQLL